MDSKTCRIFVTVGSRNYPFDRLFKKLDELCEEGIIKGEMFAQTGSSTYQPKHYQFKDFIPQDEFLKKVEWADIVVSHGASGSIMKALNAGKKVIAVTRLEKYGEHMTTRYRIMRLLQRMAMWWLCSKWAIWAKPSRHTIMVQTVLVLG